MLRMVQRLLMGMRPVIRHVSVFIRDPCGQNFTQAYLTTLAGWAFCQIRIIVTGQIIWDFRIKLNTPAAGYTAHLTFSLSSPILTLISRMEGIWYMNCLALELFTWQNWWIYSSLHQRIWRGRRTATTGTRIRNGCVICAVISTHTPLACDFLPVWRL